jgi:hypothetical protein
MIMRILIDIPKKIEEYIKDYIPIGAGDNVFCYPDEIVRMIQNGTPIPDNATNGDVIKALFPNEHDFETDFDEEWWNAPYRKGGK